MRPAIVALFGLLCGVSCIWRRQPEPPPSQLASRPCPPAQALRAAFLADSHKANVDDLPLHSYVTYLVNGRIVAANLRQDSLAAYGPIPEISALPQSEIRDIRVFSRDSAPPELGICAGVGALELRTTGRH
jgi:hypothetical protein